LAGSGALLVWLFLELSDQLFGDGDDAFHIVSADRMVLRAVASLRRGWLTGIAMDLTALGSATVLTLCTAAALTILLAARDRAGAIQLFITAVGSAVWIGVLKQLLERDRPLVVPRLVEVSGFSYPSGHSLAAAAIYTTLAILTCREIAPGWPRAAVLGLALALIVSIGFSRIYLGVHYPSDVLAGILLGCGWAFLAMAFGVWLRRAPSRHVDDRSGS
jgi:undecaprenyl-diphosphatase